GEVKQNLAGCLEAMGDAPEAASSYGQLAIASLEKGAAESAVLLARRAVALQPENTQQLILVRCLLAAEDTDGAVAELVKLARRFTDEGKIEEARSTCLKALQIKRDDPEVRRHLSLLQQQAGRGAKAMPSCAWSAERAIRARGTPVASAAVHCIWPACSAAGWSACPITSASSVATART
ncbi:MAG: hypothetical protein ACOCZK_07850, partial [Planctomycetota bacterium]